MSEIKTIDMINIFVTLEDGSKATIMLDHILCAKARSIERIGKQ